MKDGKKDGEGAIDIAEKLVRLTKQEEDFKYIYELEEDIKTKIKKVANKIYGAKDVEYSEEANKVIEQIADISHKDMLSV